MSTCLFGMIQYVAQLESDGEWRSSFSLRRLVLVLTADKYHVSNDLHGYPSNYSET